MLRIAPLYCGATLNIMSTKAFAQPLPPPYCKFVTFFFFVYHVTNKLFPKLDRVRFLPNFQELALFPEFTIPETLSYFGRLHGMSGAEIERGSETLTQVLDLPPHRNRAIKTLR